MKFLLRKHLSRSCPLRLTLECHAINSFAILLLSSGCCRWLCGKYHLPWWFGQQLQSFWWDPVSLSPWKLHRWLQKNVKYASLQRSFILYYQWGIRRQHLNEILHHDHSNICLPSSFLDSQGSWWVNLNCFQLALANAKNSLWDQRLIASCNALAKTWVCGFAWILNFHSACFGSLLILAGTRKPVARKPYQES